MARAFVALWLVPLLLACGNPAERESRAAARGLVKGGDVEARVHMARLVALGPYALVDIEQEYHGAGTTGRLRLIEAVERIGDAEALSFLRHLARWEEDRVVQREARRVLDGIAQRSGRVPARR